MKKVIINKNKKGFSILAVILVIVAVIVTIGIWTLSGQSNNSSLSSSSADVEAAAIINNSGIIKLEFDKLVINGVSPTAIGFYLPGQKPPQPIDPYYGNVGKITSDINILDPIKGISLPTISAKAINNPDKFIFVGNWTYGFLRIGGIGILENPDQVIALQGLKKEVCESINKILHGSKVSPKYVDAQSENPNLELSNGDGFKNYFQIRTLDDFAPETTGWTSGCIGNDDENSISNTYFLVLKAH